VFGDNGVLFIVLVATRLHSHISRKLGHCLSQLEYLVKYSGAYGAYV